MSIIADLETLSDLRKRGELSNEEYRAAKQHVLRLASVEIPAEAKATSQAKLQVSDRKSKSERIGKFFEVLPGLVVLFVIFAGLKACLTTEDAHVTVYSKADFQNKWPYPPYDEATVQCRYKSGRPMVTVMLGTTEYGLNGAAISTGGYPDPKSLVPRNEYSFEAGPSATMRKMLEEGLNNCSPPY